MQTRPLICSLLCVSACTSTLDVFGAATGSSGEASEPANTTPNDTSSTGGTASSDETLGEVDSSSPVTCDQLDMLLVVDPTDANAQFAPRVANWAPFLLNLLSQTDAPWNDDFRVAVTWSSDLPGPSCRRTGELSVGACGGDRPWIESDDSDAADRLACLSDHSSPVSDVRAPALAMLRGFGVSDAVEDDTAESLACNDGFARPGSFKVAFVLTAADDDGTPADPTQWRAAFGPVRTSSSATAILSAYPLDTGAGCQGTSPRLSSWLDLEDNVVETDWCTLDTATFSEVNNAISDLRTFCTSL